jgi:hypothetical protein
MAKKKASPIEKGFKDVVKEVEQKKNGGGKKPPKRRKRDLIDDDESGSIETKIDLHKIMLTDLQWKMTLKVRTILPRAYHLYTIRLKYDEGPLDRRIEHLEQQMSGSLFKGNPAEEKKHDKLVADLRLQKQRENQECEPIEFSVRVEKLAYKDGNTVIDVLVPDDVIEAFNRQKHRLNMYGVTLIPQFDMKVLGKPSKVRRR